MRLQRPLLFVGACLLIATSGSFADPVRLLAPEVGDLTSDRLRVPSVEHLVPDVPRDPVHVSFSLDPARVLDARPTPPVSESKSYFLEVEAARLVEGVAIATTAPGTVIRVHPVGEAGRTAAVDALAMALPNLVIEDAAGVVHRDGLGVESLADTAALAAAGARFPEGTAAFRVATTVAAGQLVLRAPQLAAPEGSRYQVHVFEPASSLVLRVGARQGDHLIGTTAFFDVEVADGATTTRPARVEGFVTASSGAAWPVTFARDGADRYRASVDLDAAAVAPGSLWQIHVRADGDGFVRNARAPFAVAVPSARFIAVADAATTGGSVVVRLPVEAAAAGRYAARGVLYATGRDGALAPVALGESAAWIEAGASALTLRFDLDEAAGFGPPYAVRDLTLLDQGRMGVLHRQALGLTFD